MRWMIQAGQVQSRSEYWTRPLQWLGSEYQPFNYRKCLNAEILKLGFQMVRYLKGWFMCFVLCTGPTIQIPDQYIKKQDSVHLSGIQMVGFSGNQIAFKYQTI